MIAAANDWGVRSSAIRYRAVARTIAGAARLAANSYKVVGGPVEAEIEILPEGHIKIVVLKEVVETVEDPAREISLQEARWDDPDFQEGDLMEIPVSFREFGRSAVMAVSR